jgi:hypothetical protein
MKKKEKDFDGVFLLQWFFFVFVLFDLADCQKLSVVFNDAATCMKDVEGKCQPEKPPPQQTLVVSDKYKRLLNNA